MAQFYRLYLTLIALLLLTSAHAQKQADWWYFGTNAGMHFVNGVPQVVTNGQCSTSEGCAALSDAQGNLLMYTDGIYVWNSSHSTMQNGTGLYGDPSSTQSGIIVPKPGSTKIFYVFSVDSYGGTHGLNYSIADLSYNSGLGKVTTKNVALTNKAIEKTTSVRHSNGIDYWVMCMPSGKDSMYAYLVTSSGVNSNYVSSYTGDKLSSNGDLGYLKVSPDGKKIAYAKYMGNKVCYGDFDASSGKCSNMFMIDTFTSPYGVEFSPSGNILYSATCTTGSSIYQYNLKAGTNTQIKNSKKAIFSSSSSIYFGSLQLASNGKIYVAKFGGDTLGEISSVDSLYPKCKYKSSAVYLKGKKSQFGLPTFIQSFFLNAKFNYSDTCVLNTTKFSVKDSAEIDSVLWEFGDAATGSSDTSYSMTTQHQFSKTGNYKVTLYYWYNGIADTTSKTITIDTLPVYYFPKDTFICGSTKTNLSVPNKSNYFYMWNTGDTVNSILVDTPGTYWVEIFNTCGSVRDSVTVVKYIKPIVNLGDDTIYCSSFSRILDASNSSCKYLWSTGDTASQITVNKKGKYWVKVSNICYTIYDTITLDSLSVPQPKLGNDTLYCGSFSRKFNVLQPKCSYLWNTGDTVSSFTINSKGTYIINVTNTCGTGSDTIDIDNMLQVSANLGKDTVYCSAGNIILDAKNVVVNPYISKNRYIWSIGDTTQTIQVQPIGTIWVKVYNTCFSSYDTVSLLLKSIPRPNLGNDTFTCNTISFNLNTAHPYSRYLWNSGDTNSSFSITSPGTYWVKVYNECGQNTDTINIKKVVTPTVNLGSDTFYCSAFNQTLDATFAGAKYLWNTGDTAPLIHATSTGIFSVRMSNECGFADDSISIILYNSPAVNLGNDTIYCNNFTQKLDITNSLCNYLWNTGDTMSSIIVNKAGTYSVNVFNKCWQKSDTINIEQPLIPAVNLGNDTIYCGQFGRDFDVTSNLGDRYIWNTNDTTAIYHITTPNTYSVKIYNACFSAVDSIIINQQFPPQINLGNDTSFCADFNFQINPQNTSYNYIWSTGDTSKSIIVKNAGSYWAEASNYCGTQTDSIDIARIYRPTFFDLGNDTTICFNESINLSQSFNNLAHSWSTGDTTSTITIYKLGTYWARVTDHICNYFDTIKIYNFPHKILKLGNTKSLCMDQHDTVVFNSPKYMSYNWQPGNITTDSMQITKPGIYNLFVTDSFGCKQSDSVEVIEICPPKIWMPNAFTPGHKDTLNDVFRPTLFMVDTYTLDIYNRWGEHIYSGTEQDAGWDGTYRGVNCNTDIYIWTVTYNSHLLPKYTRGGNASGVVYIIR